MFTFEAHGPRGDSGGVRVVSFDILISGRNISAFTRQDNIYTDFTEFTEPRINESL